MKKETEIKKKKRNNDRVCGHCLEIVKPTSMFYVTITNCCYGRDETYQIPICEDCIEKKEEFSRYKFFEVGKPLYKKREYKKKNAQ